MSIATGRLATVSVEIGGQEIAFETGRLAKQAGGAVAVRSGDTMILATAVGRPDARPDADFFPLTVDVEERMYAAGKIPGGFFKREGRATERATLTARMIDRPIRPLWPKGFRNEVHVVCTVLSADLVHPHDILCINGASAALAISPLPFLGPVGAVRIARVDGALVVNPTLPQSELESDLDLIVVGTRDALTMVEAGADQIPEDTILEALELAHAEIRRICDAIDDLRAQVGKPKWVDPELNAELEAAHADAVWQRIQDVGIREASSVVDELVAGLCPAITMDSTEEDIVRETQVKAALNVLLERQRLVAVEGPVREQFEADLKALTDAEQDSKELKSRKRGILFDRIVEDLELPFPVGQAAAEGEAPVKDAATKTWIKRASEAIYKDLVRHKIAVDKRRPDGRGTEEIRAIECEVRVSPRTHGSALFTRGQTQIMTLCTLGTAKEGQRIDDLSLEQERRYMHHYNFPPFSVGETGFMRGPKRRDIGHGALAQRALESVIPSPEEFPYTIRLVSETLESNGSSSMGSVCGSTLALMDAGVPIAAPVSGIAMGLVKEGDDYVILTDIQGAEDHLGDMDFKVAGTEQGITALQMDIKITGVTQEIMRNALEQAKRARVFILGRMLEALPAAREELADHAPRISTVQINPEFIGMVIGKGGETIRGLEADFDVQIDIEEDGTILVYATEGTKADAAIASITALTKSPEVGDTYTGKVVKTTQFGAFVELKKGTDGLLHVSNVGPGRVGHIEDVIVRGDVLDVLVQEVDKDRGRIGLKLVAKHENGGLVQPEELIERAKDAPPREPEEPRGPRAGGRAAATAIGARAARSAARRTSGSGGVIPVGVAPLVSSGTGARPPARPAATIRAMLEHRLSTLPGGERVVTERIDGVRSAALGLWVATGSRDEPTSKAGVSHFIEHLLFKGSERYGALEIAEIFDAMGGELNAATSRETTVVYTRVPDDHVELALDVMVDMVFEPTFADVDAEREVVLEEIAMVEDTPQDFVHDLAAEAVFGTHPLGRPVIGSADVIASVSRRSLRAYHGAVYTGRNIVLAAAGNIDHDRIVELLRARRPSRPTPERAPRRKLLGRMPAPSVRFRAKRTEQYHVCLSGPGLRRGDERRFAGALLDAILGGSASSRLFQEIREKRGMAYSVYTFGAQFAETGQVGRIRGHPRGQPGRLLRRPRRADRRPRVGQRARDRARSCEGEHEGPPAALARVDVGAHDPPGQVARSPIRSSCRSRRWWSVSRPSLPPTSPRWQPSSSRRSASQWRPSARPSVAFAQPPVASTLRSSRRPEAGVRVCVFGVRGKVGSALVPALAAAGNEVVDADPAGCAAAVDFTRPDAVVPNVRRALDAGVPVVIGTTGFPLDEVDVLAREAGLAVLLRAELRARCRPDDALRRGGVPGVPAGRDRRAARRHQARRSVRYGQGDRREDGG